MEMYVHTFVQTVLLEFWNRKVCVICWIAAFWITMSYLIYNIFCCETHAAFIGDRLAVWNVIETTNL